MGGESGDAQVMVDGLVATAQMPGAVQQGSVIVALGAGGAGQPAVLSAVRTVLAARQKRHDHALSGQQIVGLGPDLDDTTGRLVAEQHGHRPDPVAVDNAQVRVADPGGFQTDQDLSGPGCSQVEFGDADGLGLSEGAGSADFLKYCTGDLHRSSFLAASGFE